MMEFVIMIFKIRNLFMDACVDKGTMVNFVTKVCITIRRRSDYVMGIIAPAIGPNSSKKVTQ